MDRRLIIIVMLLWCFLIAKAQNYIALESSERPIVKVNINGSEAYMLIDTGSSINILTMKAVKAHRLRIRTIYAGGVYSATTEMNAIHVDKAKIDIRGALFYQFLTIDISLITKNIFEETGIEISGIIGTPAIISLGMVVDLKRGIITINK